MERPTELDANQATIRGLIVILSLGLGIVFVLMSPTERVGQAALQPLDLTPTAYAYLPLVAKKQTATATPTPTATQIPPDDIENEQSIANQLNQQRNAHSLPSLTLVLELTQAARRHSRDMADNNFTSHTGSDGSSGGQRMEEAGYEWTTWGEIIGWGFGGDTSRMVDWWMNSPTHESVILSNSYADFGVGYARNSNSEWEHYWTVNFGEKAASKNTLPQTLYSCTFFAHGKSGGSSLTIHSLQPCR